MIKISNYEVSGLAVVVKGGGIIYDLLDSEKMAQDICAILKRRYWSRVGQGSARIGAAS